MDKEEKVTRAFIMEQEAALLFYVLVKFALDHGSKDSEQFRTNILNWMAKNHMMNTVYDTKRTKDQIVADYKKRGFNVADNRRYSDTKSKDNTSRDKTGFFRKLARMVKILFMGDTK